MLEEAPVTEAAQQLISQVVTQALSCKLSALSLGRHPSAKLDIRLFQGLSSEQLQHCQQTGQTTSCVEQQVKQHCSTYMSISSAELRILCLILLLSVNHAIRVQPGPTALETGRSEALQSVLQETAARLQQVAAAATAAQHLLKANPDDFQQSGTTLPGHLIAGPVNISLPAAAAAAVGAVLSLHGSMHGGLQGQDQSSMFDQAVMAASDHLQHSRQQQTTAAEVMSVAQERSAVSKAAQDRAWAADAQQSSSRKLQYFSGLSTLSVSLPDLEALLTDDYQAMASSLQSQPVSQAAVLAADASHAGSLSTQQQAAVLAADPLHANAVLTQQSTATAAAAVGAAAAAVGGGSSASGGTFGAATNPMALNCFSLPIELCVGIRRGNLESIKYAYPYLFGYYTLVLIQLYQTIMNASSTGTMVVDAQLLLSLLEQMSTLTALNGGLVTLVTADRLMQMMPM
jgi:hypothetical protein